MGVDEFADAGDRGAGLGHDAGKGVPDMGHAGPDLELDIAAGKAHSLVASCLANGRPEAAEYLAQRGAPLDLEAAAGIGRLDVVKMFFDERRSKPKPTIAQLGDALKRASAYGRTNVVEFLLERGAGESAKLNDGVWIGTTALHLAAFSVLLARPGKRVSVTLSLPASEHREPPWCERDAGAPAGT